jgi:hypothetical protein
MRDRISVRPPVAGPWTWAAVAGAVSPRNEKFIVIVTGQSELSAWLWDLETLNDPPVR